MAVINKFLIPVSEEKVRSFKVLTSDSSETASIGASDKAVKSCVEIIDVKKYFASKGFDIQIDKSHPLIKPIETLAVMIANNYRYCKFFLKHIRENITNKSFHINYSVAQFSEEERAKVVYLAEKFGDYGIISNVFYNHTTGVISGIVSSAPRVINLINGTYLEYYARTIVEKNVKAVAENNKTDYEVYSNAIVSKDKEKHELDIVFRVGKYVFWSEVKSGKFNDFNYYYKLGISMGVNPNRHILLAAEKETDTADAISWLYQFYVSNIENYENKLIEMIDNAFKEVAI